MKTSIDLVRGTVRIKTGSEGPKHDPYSYTEYTFEQAGKPTVTFHAGLGVWLEVDGKTEYACDVQEENLLFGKFESVLGFSINDLEKWHAKARSRCRKCGCKRGHWVDGYPGESFLLCDNCGVHMDCLFDESVIQ
jgi:hypothetical protein